MTSAGPPVVLVGGVNSLTVARCLGRKGVRVLWMGDDDRRVSMSRYCERLPVAPGPERFSDRALAALTGPSCAPLEGAVLLATNDKAVELLARHRDRLAERFLLDDGVPATQLLLLNKLASYRAAREAGVPTPGFWTVAPGERAQDLAGDLVFPLIVKPVDSAAFQAAFPGAKHLRAERPEDLAAAVRRIEDAGLAYVLVERIPGPDALLCSYYTHIGADGVPGFHFTKRVLRRYPPGEGEATVHLTAWIPELQPLSLRLLEHVGHRGLANAEYKRDPRDGVLKLIEVNVRFTAGNPVVARAGMNLPMYVYERLTGGAPRLPGFRPGARVWHPRRDIKAARALRARGELTWVEWARTLRPAELPFLAPDDPMPAVGELLEGWRRRRPAR